ncbi:MAG: hypothetical protein AAFX79_05075 [Planctomycetota bacterium]
MLGDIFDGGDGPRSGGGSGAAATKIRRLEDRIDQLVLINMAMWSILSEKARVGEDELIARVEALDLADGQADGKMRVAIMDCQACGRRLNIRHQKCLYCGAEMQGKSAFDKVL